MTESSKHTYDVAILGGGVVGLSLGRALARARVSVVLLERGRVGSEASSAAAGILKHLDRDLLGGPLRNLAGRASREYQPWVGQLVDETGIAVSFERRGILTVALGHDPEATRGIEALARAGKEAAIPTRVIDGDEARRLLPLLGGEVSTAHFAPDDAQVDPRQLVAALRESCLRQGVAILENAPVDRVERQGTRFSIRYRAQCVAASKIAVALGAWSSSLGIGGLAPADVFAVRGQMLVFAPDPRTRGPVVFREGHGYLLSRHDGKLLAGSTLEPHQLGKHVTAEGAARLACLVQALMPGLCKAPLVDSWAGLRPQHRRAFPIVGESEEGIFLCTGHYMNGIFLGPASAELLAEAMLTGRTPEEILPLAPSQLSEGAP